MISGILNINKPKNLTSHDVINATRRILKIKKIGHTGTLDPLATGVLPLCVHKSTKIIQYLPTDKQYIAEITLGISTSSYDSQGEILSSQKVSFDKQEILSVLESYKGEIKQQVPMYSATHYKGKKLYEYAHKGINIDDLPVKIVSIYDIQLTDVSLENEDYPVITIKVDCGQGTYIRSLANELGKTLGCGAHLSNLVRTKACGLNIESSITLEELENKFKNNEIDPLLINPSSVIDLSSFTVGYGQIERLAKGQYFRIIEDLFKDKEKILLINKQKEIVAIGEYDKHSQLIKPISVLLEH